MHTGTARQAILAAILFLWVGCYGAGEGSLNSGGAGGFGADSDDPSAAIAGEPSTPFVPAPLSLRTLLGWQYKNSVRDLLSPSAAAAVEVPADTSVSGFDAIGAAQLSLSPRAVELYEQSARSAAKVAFADAAVRDRILGCTPRSVTDDACWRNFIGSFGRLAWRRSLAEDELSRWVEVGKTAGSSYGNFNKAAELVLAGLLQSPNFLMLVETGEPDASQPTSGAEGSASGSRRKLSGLELASRLAFFFTGSTPSEGLIDAAERGNLDTADGVRAQARALLADPRSQDAVLNVFDELLDLRNLDTMIKSGSYAVPSSLMQAMKEESHAMLRAKIFEESADIRTLFDADYTYVNAPLAAHYGLGGAPDQGFGRVALPAETGRAGFLGQASFLALQSHPASTSPTYRGKFVRERLLCQPVPAPPPNVNTLLPDNSGNGPETMRQRLQGHQTNPSCAGCHTALDNVGLALENYDAIGRYRTTDQGLSIDAASTVPDLGSFSNPRELGQLVRNDPRLTDCLSRNIFRAAVGHVETDGEAKPIYRLHHGFEESGFQLQELLVDVVSSDAFRFGTAEQ